MHRLAPSLDWVQAGSQPQLCGISNANAAVPSNCRKKEVSIPMCHVPARENKKEKYEQIYLAHGLKYRKSSFSAWREASFPLTALNRIPVNQFQLNKLLLFCHSIGFNDIPFISLGSEYLLLAALHSSSVNRLILHPHPPGLHYFQVFTLIMNCRKQTTQHDGILISINQQPPKGVTTGTAHMWE